MDWAAIITPGVVSSLIAGFVSITTAIISYRANRKKTKSEIEKMKLEWERQDKLREEENRRVDQLREEENLRAAAEQFQKAAGEMLASLSAFSTAPDKNSCKAALAAVDKVILMADNELAKLLNHLHGHLEADDPFDGLSSESRELLKQIRIQLRK